MFDILSFFKKKPAVAGPADRTGAQAQAAANEIKLDDVAVHSMPERFRRQPVNQDQAKKTGLIIIAGGAVFLIVLSVSLYFLLFKTNEPAELAQAPEAGNNQPAASQAAPETQAPAEQINEATTSPAVLPPDLGLATSTATTTEEVIEPSVGFKPGADTDADGLTDAEEALLGTSSTTPDTDGDTYVDGSEVANLYDPAGPGKLAANPGISLYENKTFGYSFLYPKAWQLSVNGGDDSVMFKTADNQFIQAIVQPNPTKQSLDDWYLDQLELTEINPANRLSGPPALPTGQASWQGLMNPDGLTLYFTDAKKQYIYSLTYNPGQNSSLEFMNIFRAMIKSLALKD